MMIKRKILLKKEKSYDIENLIKNPELGTFGELAEIRKELAETKLKSSVEYIRALLEETEKVVVIPTNMRPKRIKRAPRKYDDCILESYNGTRHKQIAKMVNAIRKSHELDHLEQRMKMPETLKEAMQSKYAKIRPTR